MAIFFSFLQPDEPGSARTALEGLSHPFRDLSAWRVALPRVEERLDVAGKLEFVFIVDVTRIDVSGGKPLTLYLARGSLTTGFSPAHVQQGFGVPLRSSIIIYF